MEPEALAPLLTRIGFFLENEEDVRHTIEIYQTELKEIMVRLVFPDGTEVKEDCQEKLRMIAGEALEMSFVSTATGNPAVLFK